MINRRAFLTASTAASALLWALPTFAQETTDEGTETGNPEKGVIADMVLGDAEAPIEVIEYASFTCPHCANFHASQFKELKANYIDTGKVRFVYREVYFDRPGLWASMIARCGGEEKFFGITDLLYQQQQDWGRSNDPNYIVDRLKTIGLTAGIPQEDLDACMTDADKAQSLYEWYTANQEADEIDSTPSFVIDGTKYTNMSYGDFSALLDEKLAELEG